MIEYLYIGLLVVPIGLVAFNAAYWGGIYRCICFSELVMVSFAFMLFQAGMCWLGSWVGGSFAQSIGWMAVPFAEAIILLTGIKLIFSAFLTRPEQKSYDLSRYGELLAVSLASSLNAFMIGLGFGLLREMPDEVFAIIAVLTAGMTVLGNYVGKRNGKTYVPRTTGTAAGILLILLTALLALDLYDVV